LGGGQMQCEVCVYTGEALARYGFPGGHPFGVDRHGAFVAHLAERGLAGNVCHREPVMAARAVIGRFHTAAYVASVMQRAVRGGYSDHGDGVFYAFEDDPGIFIADIHEDGRSLYPGTGAREETGTGAARGTKLNIPLRAGAADDAFFTAWGEVEEGLRRFRPEFIILQCGADSIAADPLAHLLYTPAARGHAAARLAQLAAEMRAGRLLALGGGGYDRSNLARAWTAVVAAWRPVASSAFCLHRSRALRPRCRRERFRPLPFCLFISVASAFVYACSPAIRTDFMLRKPLSPRGGPNKKPEVAAGTPTPQQSARNAARRYVSDRTPGIRREADGQDFRYVDAAGHVVRAADTLARIKSLAIPPAWREVWICPLANGHLQATGRDARGRKQYRYHPAWRR